MKIKIWLLVAVLIATMLACESSGSATNSRKSCSSSGNSGTCEGSFGSLTGKYSQELGTDALSGNLVNMDGTFAVESGSLRVWIIDKNGAEADVLVTPGEPASLSGITETSMDGFTVYFEAVDGEAAGITYTVNYRVP
jgi:hypothetical protein